MAKKKPAVETAKGKVLRGILRRDAGVTLSLKRLNLNIDYDSGRLVHAPWSGPHCEEERQKEKRKVSKK